MAERLLCGAAFCAVPDGAGAIWVVVGAVGVDWLPVVCASAGVATSIVVTSRGGDFGSISRRTSPSEVQAGEGCG